MTCNERPNTILRMVSAKPTGPRGPAVIVSPVSGDRLRFEVLVREGASESRHDVTLSPADAARFPAVEPARIVEAAMRFLLDREPKESILSAFDTSVIRRYFPEVDGALDGYLG